MTARAIMPGVTTEERATDISRARLRAGVGGRSRGRCTGSATTDRATITTQFSGRLRLCPARITHPKTKETPWSLAIARAGSCVAPGGWGRRRGQLQLNHGAAEFIRNTYEAREFERPR